MDYSVHTYLPWNVSHAPHPPDRELQIAFQGGDPSALRHAYHEHEARGETKTCSGKERGHQRYMYESSG